MAGIAYAVLKGVSAGTQFRWGFVIRTPDAGYTNAVDVAEFLANGVDDHLKQLSNNTMTWYGVDWRPLAPTYLPSVEVSPAPFPITGTASGVSLPHQVCMLVNFSRLAEKPNVGRKFLGPMAANSWSAGAFVAGFIQVATDWAAELLEMEDLLGTGYQYISAGRTPEGLFTYGGPFTDFSIQPYARIQRRRRPGVGI